ncbi:MAG: GDSL-type esterase/lipase family protein [bacterium]|nr:GDSL-type esterase/lipase family protein [bacterium]
MSGRKIFLFGDSLFAFFDWQKRFPGEEIFNLGISGETVEGLLARLERGTPPSIAADLVFFMTGINNVAGGDVDFLPTYRRVVHRAKSAYPQATIFVHSLLPTRLEWIDNRAIDRINEGLQALAREEAITFIDIHRLFLERDGRARADYLLADGVHLSPLGYRAWAEALEQMISASEAT